MLIESDNVNQRIEVRDGNRAARALKAQQELMKKNAEDQNKEDDKDDVAPPATPAVEDLSDRDARRNCYCFGLIII